MAHLVVYLEVAGVLGGAGGLAEDFDSLPGDRLGRLAGELGPAHVRRCSARRHAHYSRDFSEAHRMPNDDEIVLQRRHHCSLIATYTMRATLDASART